MRFRTQLLGAFALLAVCSAVPLAWTSLHRYSGIAEESDRLAFRQAEILLDAFVSERADRLALILGPFSEDARIRAAMMARADLSDPQQLGTDRAERYENARNALASWVDEAAAALQDFVMLVGRDGEVAYAVGRKGGRPLDDSILQSAQVRYLVGAATPERDVRMLWSGPRLRSGPPEIPDLEGQVFFAAARILRYRFSGTGSDEVAGLAVVAERFDLAAPLQDLAKAGVSVVFIDKGQPVAWHFDASDAAERAADAARWSAEPHDSEELELAGAPYFAREYRSTSLADGPLKILLLVSRERAREARAGFLQLVASTLLFTLLGAAGLAALVASRIGKPVGLLIGAAERVAGGDLQGRVEVRGPAELSLLASRFNQMVEGLRERELARDALGRYLSPDVARQVLSQRERIGLQGERRTLTLLFCDLAGFTGLSERMDPEALVRLLNEYLARMIEVLAVRNAYVDKFEGDSIMAFWGAPLPSEHHELEACRAALEMREASRLLAGEWRDKDVGPLKVRFGLNTGEAVVGNLGSRQKLNYTAIGDEVNLASRMEGLNKAYGTEILLGERTAERVRDLVELREIDQVRVVGRTASVRVFELLSLRNQVGEASLQPFREHYERGLARFRARDLDGARIAFVTANQARQGGDPPSLMFLERIDALQRNGFPEGWDGTFDMKEK